MLNPPFHFLAFLTSFTVNIAFSFDFHSHFILSLKPLQTLLFTRRILIGTIFSN